MTKFKRAFLSLLVGASAFSVGFLSVAAVVAAADAISLFGRDAVAVETVPAVAEPLPQPPLPEPAPEIEPVNASDTENVNEFYAAGSFYLDGEKLPKEFRDFEGLEIQTHDMEQMRDAENWGVPIPPKGWVLAKKQFNFARIAINAKIIAFQTETVGGVSYRFTGEYHHVDYCETDGTTPDLVGRLIKIRDGRWAAEMKAGFYASCGC